MKEYFFKMTEESWEIYATVVKRLGIDKKLVYQLDKVSSIAALSVAGETPIFPYHILDKCQVAASTETTEEPFKLFMWHMHQIDNKIAQRCNFTVTNAIGDPPQWVQDMISGIKV